MKATLSPVKDNKNKWVYKEIKTTLMINSSRMVEITLNCSFTNTPETVCYFIAANQKLPTNVDFFLKDRSFLFVIDTCSQLPIKMLNCKLHELGLCLL